MKWQDIEVVQISNGNVFNKMPMFFFIIYLMSMPLGFSSEPTILLKSRLLRQFFIGWDEKMVSVITSLPIGLEM